MTGIMCSLVGSGGSPYNGSATVTVDQYVDPSYTIWGFVRFLTGSATPTTWANTGANFTQLCWYDSGVDFVIIQVSGTFPNEGWETMTVGGVPFTRASASYSADGINTSWTWLTASNPYGTTIGATKVVTWS
jgi:hypothetical protein